MNFLKRIKQTLVNTERQRGLRDNVLVDRRCLMELVDRFDELESFDRFKYAVKDKRGPLHLVLKETLEALYKNDSRDASKTMVYVMDILRPVINERIKLEETERIINRY